MIIEQLSACKICKDVYMIKDHTDNNLKLKFKFCVTCLETAIEDYKKLFLLGVKITLEEHLENVILAEKLFEL